MFKSLDNGRRRKHRLRTHLLNIRQQVSWSLNAPPLTTSSHMNIFDYWASFLAKGDNEDKELILIGDLNCDVNKTVPDPHTCKLQFL